LADGCDQALDGIIIAAWIMVRDRNSFHQRLLGDLHHVFDRTMPPAYLRRIFLRSVLRVMDEEVRPAYELGMV
jgi:hypothetical protein